MGASITVEQLAGDPHPHLKRLREDEPVSWLPALDCWLVTRRDLAIEVMRDATAFTVDDPGFSTARVIGPSMLSLDGPEHRRHRDPFGEPFRSPNVRQALAAWVHERAAELVDTVAAGGNSDLRAAVAAPLAIGAMEKALDLAGTDASDLLAWYEAIVEAVHRVTRGDSVPPAGHEAFAALHGAVSDSLAASNLLAPVAEHGTLSVDEIVSNVAVLLFGGIVTSESTTALVLQFLLGDAEAVAAVAVDRTLVVPAVEEALRLEPSAAVVDRYTTSEVEVAGAVIAAGDLVRVSLAGANRDPAVFVDPDRFDVRRANAGQHLTFARGPHACLGIHLARLEAVAAVEAVLDRLPFAALDPERVERPEGLVFRAPPSVHVRWDGSMVGAVNSG